MTEPQRGAPLELWGGIESTLNRVGDRYFDQLVWSGHAERLTDLDLFAALGLRRMRYPILWERTVRDGVPDWRWADERLARLRQLQIEPIVGLLHHGSGPPAAGLLGDEFVPAFVSYARSFAQRAPWVRMYTPINEPLTTARFVALYGHWHPHRRDDRCFARALVQQLRATVLAMKAIREIRPDALLMQTEDLGTITSTEPLRYQADFENERRWLTWDLLSGCIVRGHPLWEYLQTIGLSPDDLQWFGDNPCSPDLLGVNHYVTSDRFLDHRTSRYSPHLRGGNHAEPYADVEAVRLSPNPPAGIFAALRDSWKRYGRPIVVSEAHLACTREEQLRWLAEIWTAAHTVRREGVDVRAVTAWSLLGAFNWRTLVTRDEGAYDAGAFEVQPDHSRRPTALATLVRALVTGQPFIHPVLSSPGWWRRDVRLMETRTTPRVPERGAKDGPGAGLLIVGPTNHLTRLVMEACELRALAYCRLITDRSLEAVGGVLRSHMTTCRPWAVIAATDPNSDRSASSAAPFDDASQIDAATFHVPVLRLDVTREFSRIRILTPPDEWTTYRDDASDTAALVGRALDLLIDHALAASRVGATASFVATHHRKLAAGSLT